MRIRQINKRFEIPFCYLYSTCSWDGMLKEIHRTIHRQKQTIADFVTSTGITDALFMYPDHGFRDVRGRLCALNPVTSPHTLQNANIFLWDFLDRAATLSQSSVSTIEGGCQKAFSEGNHK